MNNTKINKFKVGDRVFAKIRGHSNWPAVINSIDLKNKLPKYNVTFYGSGDVACVREIDVNLYSENKVRFGVTKLKNKNKEEFLAAMREIELSFSKNKSSTLHSSSSSLAVDSKFQLSDDSAESKSTNNILSRNTSILAKSCLSPIPGVIDIFNKKTPETVNCNCNQNKKTSEVNHNLVENRQNKTEISLSLLESKWVTDDTIQVVFDILNSSIVRKDIVFISPVLSLAIKFLENYGEILLHQNLENKQFIFIPLNDSSEVQSNGGSGTHWSLLLWHKSQDKFYHFDSLDNLNDRHAKYTCERLATFYSVTAKPSLINVRTPRQTNGVDCGIHMILTAEYLTAKIMAVLTLSSAYDFETLMPAFTESDILTKRAQLALIIHNNQYSTLNKNTLIQLLLNKGPESISYGQNYDISDKQTHKNCLKPNENKQLMNWTTVKNKKPLKIQIYKKSNMSFLTQNKYTVLSENSNQNNEDQINQYCPKKYQSNKQKSKKAKKDSIKVLKNPIKLSVYADSQGRGIGSKLNQMNHDKVSAVGMVMPNASFDQVTDTALLSKSKDDVIVLIGGSNNTLKSDMSPIYSSLEAKLINLSQNQPVVITTIPHRFDVTKKHPVHDDICLANNYLKELVSRLQSVHLVDLDVLKRNHFTYHGLHINNRGKYMMAKLITNQLKQIFGVAEKVQPYPQNNEKNSENNLGIVVTEMHMSSLIEMYRDDKAVAFAHSISGDFGDDRRMTAGVAEVFAKHFDKPTASHCITNYLTLQNSQVGASVYSLVTKDKYYGKPTIDNYETAFAHLTADFKQRKLKHLICSPIGCVRDCVNPSKFVFNLMKFQHETQAKITVVSYYQKSFRQLRNGMTHKAFTNYLQNLFSKNQEVPLQTPVDKHLTLETLSETGLNNVTPIDQRPSLMTAAGSEVLSANQGEPDTINTGHSTPKVRGHHLDNYAAALKDCPPISPVIVPSVKLSKVSENVSFLVSASQTTSHT